ncbi:polysaccharide deacetylase family protein [Marinobacter orientalis]|uniref:Polysaccharide deacetylase family protein n=1 Tax=Marinobacter orientalis TaxID=1928859 RepID=A0A7Y0RCZ7_9GAMM|nr:polysaccharide deacetylase family protein [Marinobacter orientalis]NMT63975.1 polysaccharide deacetylase family protein [Marinobacter orientalis]TGX50070.1 polysaccharide deacetylase [Marinobacter orientalis]
MAKRITTLSFLMASLAGFALSAQADLVVLQYHHVSDSTPPSTSTSVSLFEGQLEMIDELGIDVVPLESATRDALAGKLDSREQVAITFDDAYESVYSTAIPELEKRGYPYTIFVNTDAIGSHGYMTWDQLEEVRDRTGVTIANHSEDHGHMAKRPDESRSEWAQRVESSLDTAQEILVDRLGIDVPMFAYPYGEFDEALEQKIEERGWLGYGQQSGAIGANSDATRLPRFPMANAYGQLNSLEHKLRSKALPVDASTLPDGVISENPPTLSFTVPDAISPDRLTCFASGQGRVDLKVSGDEVSVRAPDSFSSRRFRYNCTHPAPDGSFYWLSQQWLDLSRPED